MSFLSGIKNFIKTEILGIEENNTGVQSADKKQNKAVIECKTEAPEDKFQKEQNSAKQKNKESGTGLGAMNKTIENIPSRNFDLKKMLRNGLVERITGLSKEALNNLSQKDKNILVNSIKASIERHEALIKQGEISKDANPEELVIAFAKILQEALSEGDFRNAEEFQKAVGNIAEELGPNFNKLSNNAQKKKLKACRTAHNKKMQAELDAIKDLPEDERKIKETQIIRKYKHIQRGKFVDAATRFGSQVASGAMILLNSKDMAYGAKTVLETRRDNAEKTRTADYADYDFTKNLIKDYKEVGDEVEADSLKEYTETFVSHKSAAAACEYQENYKADRDKFETALQKQRNGEALTAEEQELLATMNSEYYTATAQGIGEGALNNVNMTASEKAGFLNKWEEDAKNYSDYEAVTMNVKKSIEQNPEHKEIKEKIADIQQNKNRKAETRNETTVKAISRTESSVITNSIKQKTETPTLVIKIANSSDAIKISQKSTKSNSQEKEVEIKSVQEAINIYGSEAITAILDDPALEHLRPQLNGHIKSCDLNRLKEIAGTCSDSGFVYICTLVSDNKREKLLKYREQTKSLCYSARQLVENMGKQNAIR